MEVVFAGNVTHARAGIGGVFTVGVLHAWARMKVVFCWERDACSGHDGGGVFSERDENRACSDDGRSACS